MLPTDRFLLNQDTHWLKTANYANVQMWIHQMDVAINRAEHLAEVKGNDIRRYLKKDLGDNDVLQLVPVQILHRKMKYGGIPSRRLKFGPKGDTRVAVNHLGKKYKQCKLLMDSRTNTTRDTRKMGSHVKYKIITYFSVHFSSELFYGLVNMHYVHLR